MRAPPTFAAVLLALVLASLGCQPDTGGGGENAGRPILGALAADATPRTIAPGGTSMATVIASDPDAGDTLTYAWTIDDPAKGAIVAGETPGTAVFTAAADPVEGTVATLTVTASDGKGGAATASVDVRISLAAGFAVPEGTANGYVGDEACDRCHSRLHGVWAGGAHALAGYAGTRGATFDATWTNVECEDCHGPGHDHATDPQRRSTADAPWDTIDVPDHTVCGTCHVTGTGAPPAYTEWGTTAHANALTNLMASGHASEGCLDCHSVERIKEWQDVVPPVAAETLVRDPITGENGITCLVCHRPHAPSVVNPGPPVEGGTDFGYGNLCMACHTMEDATMGSTPHHASAEIFQSIGGYGADGAALTGSLPTHVAIEDLCAGCHMFPSEDGSNAGHSFLPRLDGTENRCNGCHGAAAGAMVTNRHAEIDARLATLSAYYTSGSATYIDRATLSAADQTLYDAAQFDVQFITADGSRGVHNPGYTDQLLDAAETIFTGLAD